MQKVFAIGAKDHKGHLELLEIERRPVGANDVQIKVKYCGMCHSDLHHCKAEWGNCPLPSVPGHEVIGHVQAVGPNVTKFKVGDAVGVGCFVNSCRECPECKDELIQYCAKGVTGTYGSPQSDGTSHTKGGYSQGIVVDQNYVLKIPGNLDLAAAAPLLCAGITLWSPIRHYGVKAGDKVAVLGLGGLGHMGVKFAAALGCEVTVLSRSASKNDEAFKLGAKKVLITTNENAFKAANRSFDYILDTVSAKHDLGAYLTLLKTDGTLVIVGGVPEPLELRTFSLIPRRLKIGGSLVGGIKETQEMLDFCGEKNITADIELVPASYANKAWERMLKSDVKFRFVLDIEKTLSKDTVVDA
ncbi:hypothetical protein HK103_004622 [Boothiomyces macroporosus]|uniref:Enoyl reductase (ER) domain-containing protein n=1 Tax=Boothiomyces macroporosus TaxID=261099 RepID=A0AAD5UR94_9FUNG|nr:hypothetical protein HK103_004622 [Boothiomyces macroporosus]